MRRFAEKERTKLSVTISLPAEEKKQFQYEKLPREKSWLITRHRTESINKWDTISQSCPPPFPCCYRVGKVSPGFRSPPVIFLFGVTLLKVFLDKETLMAQEASDFGGRSPDRVPRSRLHSRWRTNYHPCFLAKPNHVVSNFFDRLSNGCYFILLFFLNPPPPPHVFVCSTIGFSMKVALFSFLSYFPLTELNEYTKYLALSTNEKST